MAHIPALNVPEVAPSGAPQNDYERISTSPEMFGAYGARAAEQVGGGLEKAGDQAIEYAIRQQHINNELYANDAAVPGMKEMTAEWGKFNTLEGRGAVDALPAFQDKVESIYRKTLDAAPNDYAKQLLARTMRYMANHYLQSGQTYADGQQKKWVDKSSLDAASEFYDQAALNRNNPDQMELMLRSGDEKIRDLGQLKGLEQPSINRWIVMARSRALKQIVETVATGVGGEVGDPARAAAMLEHYQAQMTAPDILATGTNLRPKLKDSRAQGIVDFLLGNVGREAPAGPAAAPIPTVPVSAPSFGPQVNSAIDNAARETGIDAGLLRTFARIESGGNPNARTGSYQGLFQLSSDEFNRHGSGNILDANANALAAARKIKEESQRFEATQGRPPDPWELYMIHQQGWGGFMAHLANPARPAWENMASTAEGQQKGDNWAKRAIWGNIADQDKRGFGNVDNVTSAQFMQYWQAKVARMGGANPAAFGQVQTTIHPDRSEVLQRTVDFVQQNHLPADLASSVIAGVNHRLSLYDSLNKTEREELTFNMKNWTTAAEDGVQNLTIPEDRIRAVFPPVQAQRMIDEFTIANHVGTVIRGMQWSTPEEIAAARRDIDTGTGVLSDMLKVHAKAPTTGPGTAQMGEESAAAETGMYFRLRLGAANQLERALQKREAALIGPNADPAAYVANNPFVKAAMVGGMGAPDQPAGAGGAAQFQTYATASLAMQEHLGVPSDNRHVLTRGQAIDMARSINSADADPAAFAQARGQFGTAWPAVFRDLVTMGKLNPSYQAVAALADPTTLNAPQDAALLANWLRETGKEKKDETELFGAQAVSTIKDAVRGNATVTQYLSSLKKSGVSRPDIDAIQNSINELAYAYKYYDKADSPVEKAIEAFTKNWHFMPEGGARVPANVYDAVSANARTAIHNLSAENVMMPKGEGGKPEEWLNLVKANPAWVTSAKGDSIQLYGTIGGNPRPVLDKEGKPIEVKFSDPQRADVYMLPHGVEFAPYPRG